MTVNLVDPNGALTHPVAVLTGSTRAAVNVTLSLGQWQATFINAGPVASDVFNFQVVA